MLNSGFKVQFRRYGVKIHSERTEETNDTFWNTNGLERMPTLLVATINMDGAQRVLEQQQLLKHKEQKLLLQQQRQHSNGQPLQKQRSPADFTKSSCSLDIQYGKNKIIHL